MRHAGLSSSSSDQTWIRPARGLNEVRAALLLYCVAIAVSAAKGAAGCSTMAELRGLTQAALVAAAQELSQ